MFFSKKESLSEDDTVAIAIHAACAARFCEKQMGKVAEGEEALKIVNSCIDHYTKKFKRKPDDESRRNIGMVAYALFGDVSDFIERVDKRFASGDTSLFRNDIDEALNITMDAVKQFNVEGGGE